MLGVKEGHTIYCQDDCDFTHHEVLVKLLQCKRNDTKSFHAFEDCIQNMVSNGWEINSEIPDDLKHFRFPLVHWAAVYGKLAVLKWMTEQKFDLAVTNRGGENALHRLVACQAHERAVDTRTNSKLNGGRRYSHTNIIQVFTKVMHILTDAHPKLLLWYDFVERNTPLQLCLKLLNESQSQRLTLYHESVFKQLCERLVSLVKRKKLSSEYVRNALGFKDTRGNTLWHTAAKSKSLKVVSAVRLVATTIKDIDLFGTNNNGDTPYMVALNNTFTEFLYFVEEYKMLVPVVKMEIMESLSENSQSCDCEPNGTYAENQDESLNYSHDNSSQIETESPAANGTRTSSFSTADERSFTEAPRTSGIINQPKIVLTNTKRFSDTVDKDCSVPQTDKQSFREPPRTFRVINQPKVLLTNKKHFVSTNTVLDKEIPPTMRTGSPICGNTSHETSGSTCECNLDIEATTRSRDTTTSITGQSDSSSLEEIVIENQIDLVVSIAQSPNISISSANDKGALINITSGSETKSCAETQKEMLHETIKLTNLKDDSDNYESANCCIKSSPEMPPSGMHLIPLLSVSENKPSCYQTNGILEAHTPISMEENISRGVDLTPVLLIKLLSEPDVSERFQSLLKDVITGDAERVDTAQSTLEKLATSKASLDKEITNSEESLKGIQEKKVKLQLKMDVLQTSEDNTLGDINKLKKEREKVTNKMKECESTCSHLKRRLSDCTGALDGLSPKQQRKL